VLTEYGITSSMSRRGNCWDNACSETLFGSLKVERLHGKRFETRRHAKDETIAWLLWYNQARLHSMLAYVSPMRSSKTGLRLRPCKPIRDSAMGYGFQRQGQFRIQLRMDSP
jgi:putative transposase